MRGRRGRRGTARRHTAGVRRSWPGRYPGCVAGTIFKLLIAAAAAYGLMRIGLVMIGGLARPIPAPPPDGELRRVNLRYRCSVCGTEIRMTKSANDDPAPPRHCMDEMELFQPAFE